MQVDVYSHPTGLLHDTGPGHPESSSRLKAVLQALDDPACAVTRRLQAPQASRAQLERVHGTAFVDFVFAASPAAGHVHLDADTVMCPASLDAALHAAGAVCAAVDAVVSGPLRRAFCAVRPPGHHATRNHAMGFCLFNNVAVAAAQALEVHGLQRVAIIDFDVHHGNGTAEIFHADARVMYASSHQAPLYPGTGSRGEHGIGNIVNAPLPAGAGSSEFREAFESVILPEVDAFAPQLLLVSAGFDAHRLDPLANLNLDAADYAWVTAQLCALAARHAGGRVVSSLEGGYSLNALRESTIAHVNALAAG